jgi:hypothetical protein
MYSIQSLIIFLIHHPDASKGDTALGILIQATGISQKLRNHVLKMPMQPGRALYAMSPYIMYGRFQSLSPLYSL